MPRDARTPQQTAADTKEFAAVPPKTAKVGQLSSADDTAPAIGLPVPLLRTISIPADDAVGAAETSELEASPQQQSAQQPATATVTQPAHPSPSPRTALAATFAAVGFVLPSPVEPAETDEKEPEKESAAAAAVPAAVARKPSPNAHSAGDSSDSGSDGGGDSDSSNSSSDDDSDDEDDEAELTPQQAAAIAAATAAICIIHAIPPRRVRGILATANSRAGLTRNLSANVMHQRKKGLRWNVTEGLWSERAPPPTAQPSMARQLSGGPTSAAGAFQRIIVAKNAGERWIGHTSKKQRSPGSNSVSAQATPSHAPHTEGEGGPPMLALHASPATAAASTTTAAATLPASSPPPSPMHSSPAAAAAAHPSPVSAAPRQYTSSARTAGASSFKARIQQGSGEHRGSAHHDSPSLSHTLSTSSNFLLKLSAAQITNLSWVALQQLFLIYSKAARTARDKLAGTGSHAGGGSSGGGSSGKHKSHRVGGSKDLNGSHVHGHHGHHGHGAERNGSFSSTSSSLGSVSHHSHHSAAGLLAPGPSFLLACGIDPSASSPPTSAQVAQASTWVDLDGGVIMTLDEMSVLALHLVQRKLELCAKELALRPEVTTGRVKLVALLKDARWMLFPGALSAVSASSAAPGASAGLSSERPSPRIGGGAGLDSMGHSTLVPPTPSPSTAAHGATGSSVFSFMHGSPHPSPAHSATPALSPPPHASLLSESQITDAFVKATLGCMQLKLTSTNFGEISWGPTMDHWKEFARFFFLYRADTNPTGSPPETAASTATAAAAKAAEGNKAGAKDKAGKHKDGKCSIM